MTCDLQLLSAYYDGLLKTDESRVVMGHLESCEYCRGVLAAYQRIAVDLRAIPNSPAPRPLESEVLGRLGEFARHGWLIGLRRWQSPLTAIAATVGIFIGIIVSPTYRQGNILVASNSVRATSILDHAVGVPVNAPITVAFTAPVDREFVQETTRIEPPAEVDYEWHGRDLVIRPKGELLPATDYRVIIVPGTVAVRNQPDAYPPAQPTSVIAFRTGATESTQARAGFGGPTIAMAVDDRVTATRPSHLSSGIVDSGGGTSGPSSSGQKTGWPAAASSAALPTPAANKQGTPTRGSVTTARIESSSMTTAIPSVGGTAPTTSTRKTPQTSTTTTSLTATVSVNNVQNSENVASPDRDRAQTGSDCASSSTRSFALLLSKSQSLREHLVRATSPVSANITSHALPNPRSSCYD